MFLLTVKEINRFHEAVEIIFDPGDYEHEFFKHYPGQYITIKIIIDGIERARSYSITGLDHRTKLKICVKRVPNGVVSNYLNDKLRVGDRVSVEKPEGEFIITKNDLRRGRNYVFISGGSGITPIIPMLKEIEDFDEYNKVLVIYGNNNFESILYREELEKLKVRTALICALAITDGEKAKDLDCLAEGILSEEFIKENIEKVDFNLTDTIFFLSGPQAVVENGENALSKLGIENRKIKKEQFFKDTLKFADGQDHVIQIRTKKMFETIKVERNISILEAGLRSNNYIDYSCRIGSCNRCVGRLRQGSVIQNGREISGKELIFACQSYPLTNDVIVDFKPRLIQRVSKYRSLQLIVAFCIGVFILFGMRYSNGDNFISAGPMNTGHEELACAKCHNREQGSMRQQLQSIASHGLGINDSRLEFVHKTVQNENCIKCHDKENDRHPIHRFNEPKYAKARKTINPTKCVSCHMEHYGVRITRLNPGFCVHCHSDLKLKNDPISPTHQKIIKEANWGVCLQCHDYHGNHVRETPVDYKDTVTKTQIKKYFNGGEDPYSEVKFYESKNI